MSRSERHIGPPLLGERPANASLSPFSGSAALRGRHQSGINSARMRPRSGSKPGSGASKSLRQRGPMRVGGGLWEGLRESRDQREPWALYHSSSNGGANEPSREPSRVNLPHAPAPRVAEARVRSGVVAPVSGEPCRPDATAKRPVAGGARGPRRRADGFRSGAAPSGAYRSAAGPSIWLAPRRRDRPRRPARSTPSSGCATSARTRLDRESRPPRQAD